MLTTLGLLTWNAHMPTEGVLDDPQDGPDSAGSQEGKAQDEPLMKSSPASDPPGFVRVKL